MLHLFACLSLAASFTLSAVNPDPSPGSASGMMQVVTAALAAVSAVMVALNTYLNGRNERERRRWAQQDRDRMERLGRKVDLNTAITKEVGDVVGKGNGLSDRIRAKLARFSDIAPDPELMQHDPGRPGAAGVVPPDPRGGQ